MSIGGYRLPLVVGCNCSCCREVIFVCEYLLEGLPADRNNQWEMLQTNPIDWSVWFDRFLFIIVLQFNREY